MVALCVVVESVPPTTELFPSRVSELTPLPVLIPVTEYQRSQDTSGEAFAPIKLGV